MNYEEKYLKYKSKYIKLKNKSGGGKPIEAIKEDLTKQQPSFCAGRGFHQHMGECWHDATTMFFLFADNIKEETQPKLFSNTTTIDDLIDLSFATKDENLYTPLVFRANNKPSEKEDYKRFIKIYLQNLKDRFINLYDTETAQKDTTFIGNVASIGTNIYSGVSGLVKPLFKQEPVQRYKNETNDEFEELTPEEIEQADIAKPVGRVASEQYSIQCTLESKKNSFYGLEKIFYKDVKTSEIDYQVGGYVHSVIFTLHILSQFLISNNKHISLHFMNNKNVSDQSEYNGFIIITENHVVALFECNGQQILYDDNTGIHIIEWRKILDGLDGTNKVIVSATLLNINKIYLAPIEQEKGSTFYKNIDIIIGIKIYDYNVENIPLSKIRKFIENLFLINDLDNIYKQLPATQIYESFRSFANAFRSGKKYPKSLIEEREYINIVNTLINDYKRIGVTDTDKTKIIDFVNKNIQDQRTKQYIITKL